ncbi:MAG: hypothetical protein ACO33A_03615 [Hyphomonas sp.]
MTGHSGQDFAMLGCAIQAHSASGKLAG